MKTIKNLIKRYQAYRDRRFLARLERVFNGNVLQSNIVIGGSLLLKGEIVSFLMDSVLEEIRKGVPVNEILEKFRQESLEQLNHLQSD